MTVARWVWFVVPALTCVAFLAVLPGSARAQDPTPAEPAEAAPAETTPPAPATTPAYNACRPECREGFTCVDGECVSACNPPCSEGEECTADARCVRVGYAAPDYDSESDESGESDEYYAPDEGAASKGRRTHDGFYLRLAAGLGYFRAWVSDQSSGAITDADLSLTGLGQLFEISFGGAVVPGVIVGGGLFTTHVFTTRATLTVTPNATGTSEFEVTDEDYGSSTLALACPFVNYYPDPRGGFNAGIGPCFAAADFGPSDLHNGFGLNAHLGGEWFVHDKWSVGLMLRLQYASVRYEDDDPVSVIVPGALLTATYN